MAFHFYLRQIILDMVQIETQATKLILILISFIENVLLLSWFSNVERMDGRTLTKLGKFWRKFQSRVPQTDENICSH